MQIQELNEDSAVTFLLITSETRGLMKKIYKAGNIFAVYLGTQQFKYTYTKPTFHATFCFIRV
jgi:hypothetical protein